MRHPSLTAHHQLHMSLVMLRPAVDHLARAQPDHPMLPWATQEARRILGELDRLHQELTTILPDVSRETKD